MYWVRRHIIGTIRCQPDGNVFVLCKLQKLVSRQRVTVGSAHKIFACLTIFFRDSQVKWSHFWNYRFTIKKVEYFWVTSHLMFNILLLALYTPLSLRPYASLTREMLRIFCNNLELNDTQSVTCDTRVICKWHHITSHEAIEWNKWNVCNIQMMWFKAKNKKVFHFKVNYFQSIYFSFAFIYCFERCNATRKAC